MQHRSFLLGAMLLVTLLTAPLAVRAEGEAAPVHEGGMVAGDGESLTAGCNDFQTCSECAFDATKGILTTFQRCGWCASTKRCMPIDSAAIGTCPDVTSTFGGFSDRCPDVTCSGAYTTNNVYFCRGTNIAALFFSLVLLLLSACYAFWLFAMWQLPWKYPKVHEAVRLQSQATPILSSWAGGEQLVGDEAVLRASMNTSGAQCPLCKLAQPAPLGPAEVCYWCDVVRLAFIPLYVGVICGLLTFIMTLAVSLKPWFADWYYALLLTLPYVTYTLFFIYLFQTRVTILGDETQSLSSFFQLACVLRGRKIATVFPELAMAAPAATPGWGDTVDEGHSVLATSTTFSSIEPPAAQSLSQQQIEDLKNEKRAYTLHIVSMEPALRADVRAALQAEIRRDELIEWWDKPDHRKIASDDRWLIQCFSTGTLFGIWLCICSNVTPHEYAITRLVSPSTLLLAGGFIAIACCLSLVLTLNGCKRVYVLTNQRIIVVAHGLFGVHIMTTNLSMIDYAAIFGYDEWFSGPVLCFSWEAPEANRAMPPIRTNRLPAITHIDEFLVKFREVSKPLTKAADLRSNLHHQRLVWRIHVAVNMCWILISPIVFVYSQITPGLLSLFGIAIWCSLSGALIQRGLRMQMMTYASLNLAKRWTDWNDDPAQKFFKKLFEVGRKTVLDPRHRKAHQQQQSQSQLPQA